MGVDDEWWDDSEPEAVVYPEDALPGPYVEGDTWVDTIGNTWEYGLTKDLAGNARLGWYRRARRGPVK